ncbi:MAG: hypothetical protein M3304_06375, partial [Actinomycetota bacterium]|nr:hypothetical protein [Actinomycetota bacterium]
MRGVLREGWRLYREHWVYVVRLAAAFYVGLTVLSAFVLLQLGPFGLVVVTYLWLLSVFWLQAPLAKLAADAHAGLPRAGVRRTFEHVYPRAGRITGGSALVALGVGAASLLLWVPALLLLTRWSLVVPVVTLENVGLFGSFARSRDLVRGRGWRVFGGVVASGVALTVVWIVVALLVGAVSLATGDSLVARLLAALVAIVVLSVAVPVIGLSWVAAYLRLAEDLPPGTFAEPERLHASQSLDLAWELYRSRAPRVVALGLLVSLPVSLAQLAAFVLAGDFAAPVGVASALVGYVWLSGLFSVGLTFDRTSTRGWLSDLARRTRPDLPRLAVVGLVAGAVFATVLGLLLLARWALVGPAAVEGSASLRGAFARSAALVSGRRGRFLVLVALSLFAAVLVGIAVLMLVPPVGGAAGAFLLAFLANALAGPYVGLAWADAYRRLRGVAAGV